MPTPAPPHPLLAPTALAALYEHARRDYPNECCGIVFGPRDEPVANTATPCENIQNRLHAGDPARFTRDARTAYAFDGRELRAMADSLDGQLPAKIIYHSHVEVGAYFSDTDQEAAAMFGEPSFPVEYVVVDISATGPRGAKQFAWSATESKYVEIGSYA